MHVHADVDVGNEVATAASFELLTLGEGIDTAENDVARLKRPGPVLPATRMHFDVGPWLDFENPTLGRLDLQRAGDVDAEVTCSSLIARRAAGIVLGVGAAAGTP